MKKQNLKITTLTISVLLLFSCGGKTGDDLVGGWEADSVVSIFGGISENLMTNGTMVSLSTTFKECGASCEATTTTEFVGSGTFTETYLYEVIDDGQQMVVIFDSGVVDSIQIVDLQRNSVKLIDQDSLSKLETYLRR